MRILAMFAASYAFAVLISVYSGQSSIFLYPGVLCMVLSVLTLLSIRLTKRWGKMATICGFGLAAGFLWTIGYQQLFLEPVKVLHETTVYLTAQVLDFPKETKQGWSVLARAELPEGGSADALLYLDQQGADIRPGDRISSVTRCYVADRTFSGEEITYYTSKGVFLRGTAYGTLTVERPSEIPLSRWPVYLSEELKERILDAFPQESGSLVLAVVTGSKDSLPQSLTTALQRTGLSHIAAVSGMHMAFLAGFFARILGKYRRRTVMIVIPVCLLFMLMTGCTPSVVRAVVMIILLLSAPLFRREEDAVTSLGTALLILLIQNPLSVAHIGLQLSFGAVAGIFLVTDWFQPWMDRLQRLRKKGRKKQRPFWGLAYYGVGTLSTTLGAQIFTIPLIAIHFSTLSLIAPLSNLLVLWVAEVVFVGGLCTGMVGLLCPAAAELMGWMITPFVCYMEHMTQVLGTQPLAAVTMDPFPYRLWTFVISFGMLFLLFRCSRQRAMGTGIVCGVTLLVAIVFTRLEFYAGSLSVTMLDVGQGQCVLIRQGRHLTLVDCGGSDYNNPGDIAADWIQNIGRSQLDMLVLTHFHEDHANGVVQLLERLKVEQIALPKLEEESALYREILGKVEQENTDCFFVEEDTVLELGNESRLKLFAPLGEQDENERGLSVLASTGVFDILLTGDMGIEVEPLLIEGGILPDVELLVAGHHGSKYATSEQLLETIDPELVLISVGRNNYYGHPAPELLERLEGREIHRTDLEGTLTVHISQIGTEGNFDARGNGYAAENENR